MTHQHPDQHGPAAELRPIRTGQNTAPFGIYLHVPFCATRCGYCDFNTYTAGELGTGASQEDWERAAHAEIELAAETLGRTGVVPRIDTVFVGGGTPSLVGVGPLARLLGRLHETFGLVPDAEVTTECNPESTSPDFFAGIREGGFTRVSLGMQSTSAHVLRVLDRTHTPGRALDAAREAQEAGFEHVNLDVIYGTPGESDDDLRRTLDDVLSTGVDHVSAYSLIVEDGTALGRRVRRGEVPRPVDDTLADRYEIVADRLESNGFDWYEVSNWARSEAGRCQHNLGYWSGGDWWGLGPGAHSTVGRQRWWNLKHPARYAAACDAGELPVAGTEELDGSDAHLERIMLGLRVASGLPETALSDDERRRAARLESDGLLRGVGDTGSGEPGFALTDRGRLLADGLVLDILG